MAKRIDDQRAFGSEGASGAAQAAATPRARRARIAPPRPNAKASDAAKVVIFIETPKIKIPVGRLSLCGAANSSIPPPRGKL
jgi:hypothetical protein